MWQHCHLPIANNAPNIVELITNIVLDVEAHSQTMCDTSIQTKLLIRGDLMSPQSHQHYRCIRKLKN
jgi:hypothetical protein